MMSEIGIRVMRKRYKYKRYSKIVNLFIFFFWLGIDVSTYDVLVKVKIKVRSPKNVDVC